ncbi:hypothetical protein KHS38_10570 [Mucilaginibacter sp. Bleaf8]|nr:hypothetical protein [Mucilaginibacter sp. Bleaf8]
MIALIGSSLSRFVVYAGFEVNQKYIAENLCVNKARPWMHCDGKCYFMKKIKQAAEKEKKQEREDQKNSFQVAVCTPLQLPKLKPQIGKQLFVPEASFSLPQGFTSIFQPPKV